MEVDARGVALVEHLELRVEPERGRVQAQERAQERVDGADRRHRELLARALHPRALQVGGRAQAVVVAAARERVERELEAALQVARGAACEGRRGDPPQGGAGEDVVKDRAHERGGLAGAGAGDAGEHGASKGRAGGGGGQRAGHARAIGQWRQWKPGAGAASPSR